MWPFRTKVQAAKLAVKYSGFMVGMGQAKWLTQSYRILANEGFETNPVVYGCVTKLARALSSVDLHLYDHTRQGKLRKIDKHDILDLINAPNAAWSGRQFLEKLATQYLIGGNAFLLGNNGEDTPSELWLLPPESTTVDYSAGRMLPTAYQYRPGPTSITYPVNQVTGRSQVLHLRTVNPLNEWYGLPPLAAASHGVDIFNAGQEWNKSLLQNEGRPSGALQMRQSKDGSTPILSDDQFARLKDEVDANYTGAHNAGRPMLLDSALEWVQMSLSSKDMDHRETMLTNARFIAACFGTPPQLVNIPGESTYCLPFDARVSTPNGPVKIGDVKTGDILYSVDGGKIIPKPVTWSAKVGRKQTYRIGLVNRDIVATANHPILIRRDLGSGQCKLEYVRVDALRPGDIAVVNHSLPDLQVDGEVTTEQMELYGFYTGDGTNTLPIAQSEGRGYRCGGRVSLAIPRGASYLDYYADLLIRESGGSSLMQGDRYIAVASSKLARRLAELGLTGVAKTKRVPSWVFRTSKDHRLAYLRGIVDSDGSVNKQGRMSLMLCNLDLVVDIWHLAISCGLRAGRIWSREVTTRLPNGEMFTGDMHGFMISSAESVAEIGTRTPEYLSKIAANLGKEKFLQHWYWTGGVAHEEAITSVIDPANLSYARVIDVAPETECDVYDIEVDGTHNFIADGVVVHNSNYQQATMAYWGDTVLPLLGILLEDINRWLPPMFGERGTFLWYDEEQIPALEPRRKEKSDRINAALYMTYDEKREAMGLEAYTQPAKPGANSLFVPANQIPIELAGTVDPNIHPALAEDDPTKPATPDPMKPDPKDPEADPKKPEGGQRPAKSVE